MKKRHAIKLSIVVILVLTGIALEYSGIVNIKDMVGLARRYAEYWWMIPVLILLQALLFTFALAGSLFLWVAATLYPPVISTFILAAGGTIGGVTAYLFSKHLTDEWVQRIKSTYIYKLLKQQDNFFTLFALRVFPAFPHSIINYSSGMLNIRMSYFIFASVLGLSIKSYVYSRIIYNATSSESLGEVLDIFTYGPLILLSISSFIVVLFKYKKAARNK